MKALKLIAAATMIAATGAAFAQGNTEFVEFTDFVSSKTRAEVRAELAADTQVARNSEFVEFVNVAAIAPRKELRAANDTVLSNQTPEFVEFVNVASTRTRAEVRNEVLQAAKPARTAVGS